MDKEKRYHLVLDEYEHGLMLRSLNDEKTKLMREDRMTDAIDELIIKVGMAPNKRIKIIYKDKNDEAR